MIDEKNVNVKEGIVRLKRLCSITLTKLDHIENLLFGQDYKPESKFSIEYLQGVFQDKLQFIN